jgi:hypothetical protein
MSRRISTEASGATVRGFFIQCANNPPAASCLAQRNERLGAVGQLLWNTPGQQRIRSFGGARCFMRTNRTPDEWQNWCLARNRVDEELKQYYRACTTGELPPQLITLSKKLDEELLKKQEQYAVA